MTQSAGEWFPLQCWNPTGATYLQENLGPILGGGSAKPVGRV